MYHQWRCNYFLPVPVPVSTSDTYTSLSNLSLFYCLYLLSLTELIDFKNTSCIAKWLYAATWPWWILFFYLDFFSIFISPQIYIFSKKNILIPNVAEKNILILMEEKKIFWFWVVIKPNVKFWGKKYSNSRERNKKPYPPPPPPPPCKLKGRFLKNMTDLFVYSYYSKTFPIYKIHVGVYYIKHFTPKFHVKLKTFLRSIQKNGVFIFIWNII